MSRLTENDSQGNWALSGVAWKSPHTGQIITEEMWEKMVDHIMQRFTECK